MPLAQFRLFRKTLMIALYKPALHSQGPMFKLTITRDSIFANFERYTAWKHIERVLKCTQRGSLWSTLYLGLVRASNLGPPLAFGIGSPLFIQASFLAITEAHPCLLALALTNEVLPATECRAEEFRFPVSIPPFRASNPVRCTLFEG